MKNTQLPLVQSSIAMVALFLAYSGTVYAQDGGLPVGNLKCVDALPTTICQISVPQIDGRVLAAQDYKCVDHKAMGVPEENGSIYCIRLLAASQASLLLTNSSMQETAKQVNDATVTFQAENVKLQAQLDELKRRLDAIEPRPAK